MASYRLTTQEVMNWERDLDMVASGCSMPKAIFDIPPVENELWNCPYCGLDNKTEVYSFELNYPYVVCEHCRKQSEREC